MIVVMEKEVKVVNVILAKVKDSRKTRCLEPLRNVTHAKEVEL